MAVAIELKEFTKEKLTEISSDLTVISNPGQFGKPVTIYAFDIDGKQAHIPFYFGNQLLKQYPNDKKVYTSRPMVFSGDIRDYQMKVIKETVDRLNSVRTFFIAMATGKGKTMTSIFISTLLKVKVCVLLFRNVLFGQWKESIQKFIPAAKIQIVGSKDEIDPDIDFYLINPINVAKRSRKDFEDIGLLIADEADALCSEKMSKSFLFFNPKYCIGLSATPDRTDELDKILDLHFGTQRAVIPLYIEHNYYRFTTKIIPDIPSGDWNLMLEFQATHEERNKIIARLCTYFANRNIIVLCKRKSQTKYLYDSLREIKESVDFITGTKKKFDLEARILICTYSKGGVGFDHPKLDMMIVASDVEERFEQYFGRCTRREDVVPIYIDLVDDHNSLQRHYKTREGYAKKVGGTICDFKKSFPDFFEDGSHPNIILEN